MFACHADDPGSTPGRCKYFFKIRIDLNKLGSRGIGIFIILLFQVLLHTWPTQIRMLVLLAHLATA